MGFLSRFFGSADAIAEVDVAATLAAMSDPNVQIVDCRTKREWNGGHIAGATLVSLGSTSEQAISLDKQRPVIVVCKSGHRSARAARQLAGDGFSDVRTMKGGLDAWKRAGNRLVS